MGLLGARGLNRQVEGISLRLATLKALFSQASMPMPADLEVLKDHFLVLDQHLASSPGFSFNGRILVLFLVFTGKYPEQFALAKWATHLIGDGMPATLTSFLSSLDYRAELKSSVFIQLKPTSRDTLYVDVSNTVDHPHNGGIQRVVRQLSLSLREQAKNVAFYRIDSISGQPRLLYESELERLVNFKGFDKMVKSDVALFWSSSLTWAIQDLFLKTPFRILRYAYEDFKYLLKAYYGRWREDYLMPWSKYFHWALMTLRWVDKNKKEVRIFIKNSKDRRKKKKLTRNNEEVLLFFNASLLLPELTGDLARVELYLNLKESMPNRFTIIVYDLIPLIMPEFCVVGDAFLNFTRLFRIADRISCISESVKRDVENFSKIVPRENFSIPKISSNLLAGDFKIDAARVAEKIEPARIPQILCVGTFEPRKNQISLLRAGYVLFKKGLKFKVVFAGNHGWLSENFFSELEELDPQREFVEIMHSITDSQLNALYHACKFTVFISHAEGFGLPILESIQRGKPVVVSNRGSMLEIANLVGGCLMVNPQSPIEIASAIEKFLTDETFYREKLGEIKKRDTLTWCHYAEIVYALAMSGSSA